MTRKELIDTFFKLSVIVIMGATLFFYYNTSQVNRFKHIKHDIGYDVFDSCTGKKYSYIYNENNKVSGWATYPLCETPQVKAVGEVKETQ